MSAVQSRPCPPLHRAGNPENQPVTRPTCFSSSGPDWAVSAPSGTTAVQETSSLITEAAAATETTPKTSLETVSRRISASEQRIPVVSTPRLQPTPFRRRLPRFIRAKQSHRPPIALQDRDLELLRTIVEYRLISTPQVLRLFSEESRDGIYRRLQKLFHHGYLNRIGTNPNAPLVYAIGTRGAETLNVSVRKDVGDPYVEHQLMIGDGAGVRHWLHFRKTI